MRKYSLIIFLFLCLSCVEEPTPTSVLNKSIAFHDPENAWSTFDSEFNIRMESPGRPDRNSKIQIDLPNEYFAVSAKTDSITVDYIIKGDSCTALLNGSTNFTEEEQEKHKLTCDRAQLYKNYYTYLYGLPMKLKDPGTILHEEIEYRRFLGKDYVMLKASYDAEVGSDVWFFYFDPASYAMEVYQFFKLDENGEIDLKSGEYILLDGIEEVGGIRMPKNRAWYYNKDDKYLGTDFLNK